MPSLLTSSLDTFIQKINQVDDSVKDYHSLYEWSVSNTEKFWEYMWCFSNIKTHQTYKHVKKTSKHFIDTRWFEGAKLNIVENLLSYQDEKVALYCQSEYEDLQVITYKQLYDQVSLYQQAFINKGLKKGDHVAAVVSNRAETLYCLLAVLSLGGVWSSCSPDFGKEALSARFKQLNPKFIISCDAFQYKGEVFNCIPKAQDLTKDCGLNMDNLIFIGSSLLKDSTITLIQDELELFKIQPIIFEAFEANHPLYVMFSSGTTGNPKCLVHGAAGTLVQHIKEHRLHCNITREDVLFYYSSCAWMMYNWLVSGLASGCALVLVDGSPFYPNYNRLLNLTEQCGITVFGTSPKYLHTLAAKKISRENEKQTQSLRLLLSTGSPLNQSNVDYVHENIKKYLPIASISGGTDIISCFGLSHPQALKHQGLIACRGLGMAVNVVDENSSFIKNKAGELVCTKPFPSMPLYLLNDENQSLYKKSYFKKNNFMWQHQDQATLYEDGSLDIWGRSDATLNPAGVRIGTADIYTALEALPYIVDSIAVSQKWRDDERVILFVQTQSDQTLSSVQKKEIKNWLEKKCSRYHVPKLIVQVPEIPYTANWKKVELVVKQIVNNQELTAHKTLQNPAVLKHYQNWINKQNS